MMPVAHQSRSLVLTQDSIAAYDLFKFRRFRLNVIGFLKLPLSINENALRHAMKDCSAHLLSSYDARADRAIPDLETTATLPILAERTATG
jgi:hypothetical protein